MIHLINKYKITGLLLLSALVICTSSCNKDVEQFAEPVVSPPSGLSLTETIAANPADSLYNRLLIVSGMAPLFSNKATSFTMFVPDNNAMKGFINAISLGAVPLPAPDAVFSAFISANIPPASAAGIVSYNTIPQKVTAAQVPADFPNLEYPTILNPTGTSTTPGFNPFARLTVFPSRQGTNMWANNIPVITPDIQTANGVIHETPAILAPPTKFLWDVISGSPDLTYLKAAIIRADSGVAVASQLQTALSSFGVNLTVLAPTDLAFKQTLTGAIAQALIPAVIQQLIPVITAQLIAGGATAAEAAAQAPALAAAQAPAIAVAQGTALSSSTSVFSNPALYGALSAQNVKGIVVYHILGTSVPGIRVFSVNLPSTPTLVKTLLNQAVPPHPGVLVQATFTGPVVSAATIKGAANATAANLILPADINSVNGVLHKIDQVLLPQ